MVSVCMQVAKKRLLFNTFDEDESGTVAYIEFCRKLFPDTDW